MSWQLRMRHLLHDVTANRRGGTTRRPNLLSAPCLVACTSPMAHTSLHQGSPRRNGVHVALIVSTDELATPLECGIASARGLLSAPARSQLVREGVAHFRRKAYSARSVFHSCSTSAEQHPPTYTSPAQRIIRRSSVKSSEAGILDANAFGQRPIALCTSISPRTARRLLGGSSNGKGSHHYIVCCHRYAA